MPSDDKENFDNIHESNDRAKNTQNMTLESVEQTMENSRYENNHFSAPEKMTVASNEANKHISQKNHNSSFEKGSKSKNVADISSDTNKSANQQAQQDACNSELNPDTPRSEEFHAEDSEIQDVSYNPEELDPEKKQELLDAHKEKMLKKFNRQLLFFSILFYVSLILVILSICYFIVYFTMANDSSKFIDLLRKRFNEQQTNLFIGKNDNVIYGLDFTCDDKKELFTCDLDRIFIIDIENLFTKEFTLEKDKENILMSLDRKVEKRKKLKDILGLVSDRDMLFKDLKPNFIVRFGIWIGMPTPRKDYDDLFCKIFSINDASQLVGKIQYIIYFLKENKIYIMRKLQSGNTSKLTHNMIVLPVDSTIFFSALLKEVVGE